MSKIKISVVSYLNSKPFLYGLEHSPIKVSVDLQFDIPSICAQKLMEGKVDIGLIPVAVLTKLKSHFIISDYCIGAVGKVASVMLYSNVALNNVDSIVLDYQSETSVKLVQIIANQFWKINPEWKKGEAGYENKIEGNTAAVIIGDRTFNLKNKFAFAYDLAEEWQKFTQLPFVFACWVSTKKMSDAFISEFNTALKHGLDKRNELIGELKKTSEFQIDLEEYLFKNISYNFDDEKKKGLNLFLRLLDQVPG